MSSWIVNSKLSFLQRFCVNVIKCGPIPKHVAFIMDGNRRYATKAKVERVDGHIKGFDKLAETLQWCLEFGITEVTVYAFSIENFKRSQAEVDTLMTLATEKFRDLLNEKDKIMEEGVCIRVIGNLSLLSNELRKLIAEAMLMTKNNNKAILNIAFAYTSRDEIVKATQTILDGVEKGLIDVEDVDEDLISNCLYTNSSQNPDIIVRTSGEVRFSDYLLWQISYSNICFTKVLWPEFCIWHLLACIFKYQTCHSELKENEKCKKDQTSRIQEFIKQLQADRIKQLTSYLE